jgi:hypothetical protein
MMDPEKPDRAEYVAPEVRSISEAEVLDELGPARAYTGNFPFGF